MGVSLARWRTSPIGLFDRTPSGAFLTSLMSSDPETTTIHLWNLAILNRPGLVLKWERHQFDARIYGRQITFSYPSSSMGMLLEWNRRAERYERIGLENPIVGMASSWKRIRSLSVRRERPDHRIAHKILGDEEKDHDKKHRKGRHIRNVVVEHSARTLGNVEHLGSLGGNHCMQTRVFGPGKLKEYSKNSLTFI